MAEEINPSVGSVLNCDALIVGAGFSGVAMLHRFRQMGLTAKIFESGTDFGGVWYWNRYPGARVDSEWPFYQLNIPEVYNTFDFAERFPGHVELRSYFAHADKVLDLRKDVQFNAHVDDCKWDDAEGRWTVRTRQGHLAKVKYLVLCSGLLHHRNVPDMPGLTDFKGLVHHSAFWPEDLDLTGKKVGLVGAGATAVQVVQEVAKKADHLTMFMRRPPYCLAMGQRNIDAQESNAWRSYLDALFQKGRKSVAGFPATGPVMKSALEVPEDEFNAHYEKYWSRGGFNFIGCPHYDMLVNKEANKRVYEFWRKKVIARIKDPNKQDLMAPPVERIPYYFMGKRPPLEQDFYEMIDQDNVTVYNTNETPFKKFTEKGAVMEDGTEMEFDVVLLATGFDSFSGSLTNMGLKNRDGLNIKEYWADGIKTYLGMMFHGFPNAFMVYTPHAPTALSNGPTIIESQGDFIAATIKQLEAENGKCVEPTEQAQTDWGNLIEEMNAPTLFPLTNSWWTGGNIPGKKVQMLTHILGIEVYEGQCLEKLDGWKGFEVEYNEGGKKELPIRNGETNTA